MSQTIIAPEAQTDGTSIAGSNYELGMNRNQEPATAFVTLAHELAHLFLGHLGEDKKLKIQCRQSAPYRFREIEAESVAFIVCNRIGVESRSQQYLSNFVESNETTENLDLYAITRAAGQIEHLLDLSISNQLLADQPKTHSGRL